MGRSLPSGLALPLMVVALLASAAVIPFGVGGGRMRTVVPGLRPVVGRVQVERGWPTSLKGVRFQLVEGLN